MFCFLFCCLWWCFFPDPREIPLGPIPWWLRSPRVPRGGFRLQAHARHGDRPGNTHVLKMLGLYLLGQNCLHLTFEKYLSSETYSRKYEKLPNITILACKNITEKIHLLKMSGPQIWLCLFTFRPIASKQLNGLTTIDTVSWLGGAVVTHPLWVQEVPGSIPGSGKGFYVWFLVLLLLCFYLFIQKHSIYRKILQFLLQC